MKVVEIIFTLFLFTVALIMFIVGLSYPYDTDFGPGPGFAPVWISGLMVILTALLTINLLRKEIKGEFFVSKTGLKHLGIYLGLIILVALLINVIGLVVGLGLFCLIIFKLIDKYSWKASVLVSLGTAVVIYVMFNVWLNIPTPTGLLF